MSTHENFALSISVSKARRSSLRRCTAVATVGEILLASRERGSSRAGDLPMPLLFEAEIRGADDIEV